MIFLQERFKTIVLARFLIALIMTCYFNTLSSQNKGDYVLNKFETYTEYPREYLYTHLNKSTLLKGETLGFTAYVFDKFDKKPSTATTNLYCVISDSLNNPIKKKLIRVKDGIASNVFNIDSLFTSGKYKISFFTNYMLNFNDEQNYFNEDFIIIDPDIVKEVKQKSRIAEYSIDILPEGGHLVYNTQNILGIIVKDDKGFGLKNKTGVIKDSEDNILSEFKLDHQGIAKCILKPEQGKSYFVHINDSEGLDLKKSITNIDAFGFNLALSSLRDKIFITFRTNESTLKNIESNNYKIVIHNGSKLITSSFSFNNELVVNKAIDKSLLFSGINIITVFDKNNKPILERLYFNHTNLNKTHSTLKTLTAINRDSLKITLKLDDAIDTSKVQNISVSILPKETKSYNFSSGIISRLYLEPYLRGAIENASYYFSSSEPKVIYDLDNLLISQGWSSYDWNNIFTKTPLINKEFEFGISVITNINGKDKSGSYMSYPLKNNSSEIFVLGEEENIFYQKGVFPLTNETYKISKSGSIKKPNAYVTFSPTKFPIYNLKPRRRINQNKNVISYIATNTNLQNTSWDKNKVEALTEVVVTGRKKETKTEQLQRKHFGTVDVIDDRTRESSMTFAMYILKKGFNVRETLGQLSITIRNPITPNNNIPLVYVDDVLLADFNILSNFRMGEVDYVVVDKQGAQAGVRGVAGVIKIYTNPLLLIGEDKKDLISIHKFPLSFSAPKNYYTPQYQNYGSDFYKEYGVLSWHPNVTVDLNGYINLGTLDTGLDSVNLYIEGFINDNTFISEVKTIQINN
jgi:hypothetical protein